MYKSHAACHDLESNTPVAHVPKASRGQGMSPPPVSSNLGFILCRLRGIAFSTFSHPPENLTHDTCKPNVHATCGKYIKGKCMQSETVCLMKSKSPKSTGEYESDVFHRFNRLRVNTFVFSPSERVHFHLFTSEGENFHLFHPRRVKTFTFFTL